MLGFQDYNGAFTTDGGRTWNYRDVSGKGWGGHEYGTFAVNPQVMWSGDADFLGVAAASADLPRRRHDLGVRRRPGRQADGVPRAGISCADPAAPAVGFASDLRTADGGATWARMTGCDGVFTAGPDTGALYGSKGTRRPLDGSRGDLAESRGCRRRFRGFAVDEREAGSMSPRRTV